MSEERKRVNERKGQEGRGDIKREEREKTQDTREDGNKGMGGKNKVRTEGNGRKDQGWKGRDWRNGKQEERKRARN
jgi:hypothetical protein